MSKILLLAGRGGTHLQIPPLDSENKKSDVNLSHPLNLDASSSYNKTLSLMNKIQYKTAISKSGLALEKHEHTLEWPCRPGTRHVLCGGKTWAHCQEAQKL